MTHAATCTGARISVQHGLTEDLHTCRGCSASVYVQKDRP